VVGNSRVDLLKSEPEEAKTGKVHKSENLAIQSYLTSRSEPSKLANCSNSILAAKKTNTRQQSVSAHAQYIRNLNPRGRNPFQIMGVAV